MNRSGESLEQQALFHWAQLMTNKYPSLEYLNGSLNGVKMTIGQAVKAKRCGMKRGFPDIFLPFPSSNYHGLFIELKIKGNYPSKEQKQWLDYLNSVGYKACLCYGMDSCIEVITKYLQGDL